MRREREKDGDGKKVDVKRKDEAQPMNKYKYRFSMYIRGLRITHFAQHMRVKDHIPCSTYEG